MQQHPHEYLDQLIPFGFDYYCEFCTAHHPGIEIHVNPDDYEKGDVFSKSLGCSNCHNENIIHFKVIKSDNDVFVASINKIECPAQDDYEMYDDYDWYQEYPQDSFYENIMNSLDNLKLLLENCPYSDMNETFYKMIFVHAITLMETYLGDTIISAIKEKEFFLERAIQNCQELKDKRLSLHQIFKNPDLVQKTICNEFSKIIFHNLSKVLQIYKAVFNITLPHPEALLKLIATRHDIVHRNGKNKAGDKIEITKDVVVELFKEIEVFVNIVDSKVQEKLQDDIL